MAKRKTKKDIRASYAVVCEGFTEWYYLDFIKSARRYPFRLKPEMPGNSDYKHIFRKAKTLLRNEEYSIIFCVLDFDKIKADGKIEDFSREYRRLNSEKIIPVLSFPCIEVWFLYHFQPNFSSRYYESCEAILPSLKAYVHDYRKEQDYYRNNSFFVEMEKEELLKHAHSSAEKSLKDIKKLSDAADKTFTEIGRFEKFLEQCRNCSSVKGGCRSCWNEYFSGKIASL